MDLIRAVLRVEGINFPCYVDVEKESAKVPYMLMGTLVHALFPKTELYSSWSFTHAGGLIGSESSFFLLVLRDRDGKEALSERSFKMDTVDGRIDLFRVSFLSDEIIIPGSNRPPLGDTDADGVWYDTYRFPRRKEDPEYVRWRIRGMEVFQETSDKENRLFCRVFFRFKKSMQERFARFLMAFAGDLLSGYHDAVKKERLKQDLNAKHGKFAQEKKDEV